MISLLKIILYFFSALALSSIVFFIIKIQNILTIYAQKYSLVQPYSSVILSRYLLMTLSILESPLIFSSLGIISLGTAFAKYENLYLSILIIIYLACITFVSLITVFICEKPVKNFLESFSFHPKSEKLFSSKMIVALSLFQTPLLFTLVLVWIHISNIKFAFENDILFFIKILFSASLIIMFSISAYGVLKGMSFLIEGFSKIGTYFPEALKKFTASNFYTTVGLVEAPIIFPFLMNLLMGSYFKNTYLKSLEEYILPTIFLLFGIVVSVVAYQSGKTSGKNIFLASKINENLENENSIKEILSLNFISQVILDARIIYIFIIIFLIILKLKII